MAYPIEIQILKNAYDLRLAAISKNSDVIESTNSRQIKERLSGANYTLSQEAERIEKAILTLSGQKSLELEQRGS